MFRLALCAAVLLVAATGSRAELVTFNSVTAELSAAARLVFYNSVVGISSPQFRVDFESGFVDEQNVSGVSGLFPGGLGVREILPLGSALTPQAIIQQGPGSIDLSNPVGEFALTQTPRDGSDLVLDFSASPVDYVAFADIDTDSANSLIAITLADTSTIIYRPDDTLAVGDSAEFLGFFRNDAAPIRELRFDFSGQTWGLDNIEYGVVPEPGGYFVVLALIVCVGRRRRGAWQT